MTCKELAQSIEAGLEVPCSFLAKAFSGQVVHEETFSVLPPWEENRSGKFELKLASRRLQGACKGP